MQIPNESNRGFKKRNTKNDYKLQIRKISMTDSRNRERILIKVAKSKSSTDDYRNNNIYIRPDQIVYQLIEGKKTEEQEDNGDG